MVCVGDTVPHLGRSILADIFEDPGNYMESYDYDMISW